MASNYQTLGDVMEDVRWLSSKDLNTLSNDNLYRIANKYYLLMVRELIGLNEDLYAEISSADLVVNQEEYPLPIDNTTSTYGGGAIKIQRVEINYDGTTNGWRVMDPISYQLISGPTILDADKNSQFNKADPKYTFKDRSIFIFPVPGSSDDVASSNANLYIFWIKRPSELAATATVPDLPKDFLNVLSWGVLIDVYTKFGRKSDAQFALRNWEFGIEGMKRLEQHPDQEQPFILRRQLKNYS